MERGRGKGKKERRRISSEKFHRENRCEDLDGTRGSASPPDKRDPPHHDD